MATLAGDLAAPVPAGAAIERAVEAFPPPRQAWYTVGVLAVVTTFALLDQNILGLLIQRIKADFHLTDSQAGLPPRTDPGALLRARGGAVLALHRPLDAQVDHRRRAVVWSLATAHRPRRHFRQLFVARVVVGAGEAFNAPAAYSMIADCFPREVCRARSRRCRSARSRAADCRSCSAGR